MPAPGDHLQRPGSGHAMLLVGYDQSEQLWFVRNSWGPTWAESGYVRIPFATLKAYSDPTHFWTIGAIEQSPGLTLSMATPDQTGGLLRDGIGTGGAEQAFPHTRDHSESDHAGREELGQDLGKRVEKAREGFRNRLRGKE